MRAEIWGCPRFPNMNWIIKKELLKSIAEEENVQWENYYASLDYELFSGSPRSLFTGSRSCFAAGVYLRCLQK